METLVDYLQMWETRRPEQTLFRFVDDERRELEHYTYQGFAERTRELAAYLSREAGLEPGDRALLVYPPGLEMVAALFACARIGVIAVPVSPPLPMSFESGLAKLAFIARDSGARAVLSTKQFEYDFRLLLGHRSATAPGGPDVDLPQLPWFATDGAQDFGGAPVADTPGPVLFLQYTSGSTSDPKGVIVTHANVIANGSAFSGGEVLVSWLPQHHDMGLISAYLFIVLKGGTTHAMSPLDFLKRPSSWLRLISEVGATHTPAPNFALEYCLRQDKLPDAELAGIDLSSLDSIVVGAEPLRARTFARFRERFAPYGLRPEALTGAYGMAEATLIVSLRGRQIVTANKRALENNHARVERTAGTGQASPQNNNQVALVSCGKPLPDNVVRIVDPQTRRALPEGRVGEVWLDGPSKGAGYWNRPELTAESFAARIVGDEEHTYLRTGDLGFVYEGELFVCGRSKDLIIVRGVNCYPSDVEAVVERSVTQVRDGCVAAFAVERDERETLVVVAELRDEAARPDGRALARAIRRQCHIDPHTIVFVPPRTIPKTSSGKVRRAQTRRLFEGGELPVLASYAQPGPVSADADAAPRDRFRRLIDSYDLTGQEECSFADLGIDSLALAELRTDLQALLEDHGAGELADEVNTRLLQRLTVAEFFDLTARFADGAGRPIDTLRRALDDLSAEYEAREAAQMRADAGLPLPELAPARPGAVTDILLTGATGFLGPFLVASLLSRTSHTLHALVRANDAAHGVDRIVASLRRAQLWTPALEAKVRSRVRVVCGDLAEPALGIGEAAFAQLAHEVDAVVHNGALVNYVRTYDALRPANVEGTRELLRLAMTGHRKAFHLVSSTFIYGWSTEPVVGEWDANDAMAGLDFGYSQTKWVAEQLALRAQRQGLDVRIYRPSLISPTGAGFGSQDDILVRLTAFMIEHGVAVEALNQVSLLPADLIADHVVALMELPAGEEAQVFNMTADDYYNLTDITRILSERHGYRFAYHDIPSFTGQLNTRCTARDQLYPLVDFLTRSAGKIAAMRDKRYDNTQYRRARDLVATRTHEPPLAETVDHLVHFLRGAGLLTDDHAATRQIA